MDEVMSYCVDVQRLSIRFEDALNAGHLDQAMASLDRIQELEPDNWLPYRLRGFALAHNGQLEAAAGEYRKALERGGDAATIYPGLVVALMKLERFDEAERVAAEGLARAPEAGSLLVSLAELKLKRQRRDEAEALLARALAIDDRDLAGRHALARLQWADGRKVEAVANFETIARLDPSDLPARVLIGQHHLERGEPNKAIEPLSQAQTLSPGDADVEHLLALAWLRHGNQQAREQKFDEALASYDSAIRIQPRYVEAHANKARLLAHLGRPEANAAAEAARQLQSSR
jgi:tetratricopeptide (TPR) repeat protein